MPGRCAREATGLLRAAKEWGFPERGLTEIETAAKKPTLKIDDSDLGGTVTLADERGLAQGARKRAFAAVDDIAWLTARLAERLPRQ